MDEDEGSKRTSTASIFGTVALAALVFGVLWWNGIIFESNASKMSRITYGTTQYADQFAGATDEDVVNAQRSRDEFFNSALGYAAYRNSTAGQAAGNGQDPDMNAAMPMLHGPVLPPPAIGPAGH